MPAAVRRLKERAREQALTYAQTFLIQIRIRWRGAARAGVHARLSHWHHTKDLRGGHGPGRETLSGAAAVHTQQEFGKQKKYKYIET